MSTGITKATRAHLTGKTLDHGLQLLFRIVRPPAPTEMSLKVVSVYILSIDFLKLSVVAFTQRARVLPSECASGAVAPELALGEELELLMVGGARDAAGGADAPRLSACEA